MNERLVTVARWSSSPTRSTAAGSRRDLLVRLPAGRCARGRRRRRPGGRRGSSPRPSATAAPRCGGSARRTARRRPRRAAPAPPRPGRSPAGARAPTRSARPRPASGARTSVEAWVAGRRRAGRPTAPGRRGGRSRGRGMIWSPPRPAGTGWWAAGRPRRAAASPACPRRAASRADRSGGSNPSIGSATASSGGSSRSTGVRPWHWRALGRQRAARAGPASRGSSGC